MDSMNKIIQVIKNINDVYILTHVYPDGDALGSAFTLCRALQKIGKNAKVLIPNLPEKFKFMENYIENQEFEPKYIISVDLATNVLLDESLEKYIDKIDICIDHHPTNRGFAPISYVDSKAAANAEIIYEIIKQLQIPLDDQIAQGIYIGISSDTGCFKYSNTTYKSHEITSELMKFGLDTSNINEKLFTIKSKKQMILEKIIYKNMSYFFDEKCAITFVTLEDMKKNNIQDQECEGIASIPTKIEGVLVGVTIREKEKNIYKVSLRSCLDTNVIDIATSFGGGGHAKAAGFTIEGNLNNVINTIKNKIQEIFGW